MKPLPPKVILVLIGAMFILPLALAWMMYTGQLHFKSENTSNLGQLVIPAVPLDWSETVVAGGSSADHSLDGFWVVLYAVPVTCSRRCLDLVTGLRQVHRASGQNHDRIKVVLLLEPEFKESLRTDLMGIYPRFNLISSSSPDFSAALRHANSNDFHKDTESAIYLVDPLGNIMMTYNTDDSPSKLSKDLKKLLTWSKLDKRS